MGRIEITTLKREHVQKASLLLAEAFAEDPDIAAIFKGNRKGNVEILKKHYRNLVVLHLPHGTSVCALFDGDIAGAMLIATPGEDAVTGAGMGRLIFGMILHAGPGPVWRGLKSALDDERHRPKDPHYYLETIGVDPQYHGCGIGGALLSHLIERADREQFSTYLSTTNPATVPFYEKYGFHTISETHSLGIPNYHMVREPNQH